MVHLRQTTLTAINWLNVWRLVAKDTLWHLVINTFVWKDVKYLRPIFMFVCVLVAVSELSGIRVVEGMVQWAISSSLPGECYGSYSLRLSQCTIEDFAILPALNLSDDAVSAIFAGELFKKLILCINKLRLYFSRCISCYVSNNYGYRKYRQLWAC